jgi:hypothetical protein
MDPGAFIRNLSTTAEFCLIVFLCFGAQTVWAFRALIRHWKGTAPRQVPTGNGVVVRVVILELLCLSARCGSGTFAAGR